MIASRARRSKSDWVRVAFRGSPFLGQAGPACVRCRRSCDLLEKPRQVDWLGVVVVATGGERLFAIRSERMGGQGDDRDRCRRGIGLEPPRRLPAVEHGKAHVHQYDFGSFLRRHGDTLRPVDGDQHFVPLSCEAAREHVPVHLVVFDQKDLRHFRSSASRSGFRYEAAPETGCSTRRRAASTIFLSVSTSLLRS